MIRVFPPPTVSHPWLRCVPVLLADILFMALLYYTVEGAGWVAFHYGAWDWSFVPVAS